MTGPGAFPSPPELRSGLLDTQLLLRLRWRMVRSRWSRAGLLLAVLAVAAFLLLAANTGALVRVLAEDGRSTAASTFAVGFVVGLDRGEVGGLVATVLGAVVLGSVLAPFSGSSVHALADVDDLAGIRPARMHRYFDSVLLTAVSTVGLLQLVGLTAVASLLTLAGNRTAALLLTWAVWVVLVLLGAAVGWSVELVERSSRRTARRTLVLLLAAGVLAALWLDPRHGTTLFGLGDVFSAVLTAVAQGRTTPLAVTAGVLVLAGLVLAAAGVASCRAALCRPANAPTVRAARRVVPMSSVPTVAVLQVLLAHAWRTTQVRRPLLLVVLLGALVSLVGGDAMTTMTVVVVAAPLSVALAMGVNVFGVLGPGMVWLAAQPHVLRRLLVLAIGFQVALTSALAAATFLPAARAAAVDLGDVAALSAAMAVSTALSTSASATSAVRRPVLARLVSRHDMIVSPAAAIKHSLLLALVAGQLGVLTLQQDGPLRAALVGAALLWAAVRTGGLLWHWQDPAVRAFVVNRASS